MTDARLRSPAASRNRGPILEVLAGLLPERARVLELAAGSGEHALHFASAMPGWDWLPSDPQPGARASIAAWREAAGPVNLRAPLDLDVNGDWPDGGFEAIVAINLLHISPWDVTAMLMARAGRYLVPGGVLFLYGPYRRRGRHTSESNAAFDANLRARDPRWGVRDLEAVVAEARPHGLVLERIVEMPANNLGLVWRRP
ncbi:class I SAM-dependent methyltransferase [Halomonas sp. M4R1S46]|uniref:class I SAM-dependent methyltransferase n=1 Tax=Halomonas sp. M4R1S46 TaxID=2982692 RepID=UPI0021E401ED|nr:class I SAM-dependent methyltransferase [Halomonas sp. M4R1S46]UYG09422.1 class I SAM-dependent methyltransferase [Halomonas sp. M4R1S46]